MQNYNSFLVLLCVTILCHTVLTETEWWQHATVYQIYPRSFVDSDGDGIGDLNGITSKMEYLNELGINAIWLSPMFESPQVDVGYDVSDFYAVHHEYGTIEDFDKFIAEAKRLNMKVMLDFVPNHSSNLCEWFINSENNVTGFEDFYVWQNAKYDADGIRQPPTNWRSVFSGSAWTWSDKREQYYLHQFYPEQPDLNYRNPDVLAEMTKVLEFWLDRGVSGFRVDAINHMFEDPNFPDEPRNEWNNDMDSYDYLQHHYTKDLLETYDVIYGWRDFLESYKTEKQRESLILMTEAYANTTFTMMYYVSPDGTRLGANIPFNFQLIYLNKDEPITPQRINSHINEWLLNMPNGHTAPWAVGSHDHSRVASRIGADFVDTINMLSLTLPGTSITYNGEEIGMVDYNNFEIKDSRDPNRTPMQWNDQVSAGFSTNQSTWLPVNPNYVTINVAAQQTASKSFLKTYKQIATLRNEPTLINGDYHAKIIGTNIFAFVRELRNEPTYVTVLNLGNQQETIDLTLFANLDDSLQVAIPNTKSSHLVGDRLETSIIQLAPYESIILKSVGHRIQLTFSILILLSLVLIIFN